MPEQKRTTGADGGGEDERDQTRDNKRDGEDKRESTAKVRPGSGPAQGTNLPRGGSR